MLRLPATRAIEALLVVGHGAGGDVDAPDLQQLATAALREGMAVALVRQPYRVAGRRAPAPARQLDAAWLAVTAALRDPHGPFGRELRRWRNKPLVFAGRSSGARVACRTAVAGAASAVLALAFPLHPPGRPERSRSDELRAAAAALPALVVQGGADAFGRPAEFPADVPVVEVPGAGHSLKSAGTEAALDGAVAWLAATCAGRTGGPSQGIGVGVGAL